MQLSISSIEWNLPHADLDAIRKREMDADEWEDEEWDYGDEETAPASAETKDAEDRACEHPREALYDHVAGKACGRCGFLFPSREEVGASD